MEYETVVYTVRNQCAYIQLNRPERLNSFDMKLGKELYEVLHQSSQDNEVKVVVLTGSGKGFCGGGDVKEMYQASDKPQFLRDLTKAIQRCVIEMRTMEKPVIALVNGAAFGAGCSLALGCDIIIATANARFGTAFIGIGLAPGCGTQLFSSVVGYQRACEYILTSKVFSADEALQLGLINKVVDKEKSMDEVEKFINKFGSSPSIAVGKAKMLINKSLENSLMDHFELESLTASSTAATKDFTEGVTAFFEKRKPIFHGE